MKEKAIRILWISKRGNAVFQSIIPKNIVEKCGLEKGDLIFARNSNLIEMPNALEFDLHIKIIREETRQKTSTTMP